MSKTKIAKISVTAGGFSVESMKVTLAVNEVPTAALTVLKNSDKKVRKPLSSEVIATLRERQQKRLAGLKSPDMTIQASDGMGGKLKFVGYAIVPVVEISTVSTTDSFTVLGVDGMLDALDLSIYQAGYLPTRGEASPYGNVTDLILTPIPAATSGQVTSLISSVTEVLHGNYAHSLSLEPHPTMQKLMEQVHGISSGLPMELWNKILSNSDVTYESWAEAVKESPPMGNQMTMRIKQILTQKVGGFWSTLNSLMATFQMYYIPDPAASGKLMRGDERIEGSAGKSMELSATGISVSDGNHSLLPIGGVVIMRPASKSPRPESGVPAGANSVAGQYPDPLLTGFIQREQPPAWLLNTEGSPVVGSDIDKAKSDTLNLDIAAYVERKGGAKDKNDKVDDAASSILDEYCEVMFKTMQLAHSTAVATVPLDFTLKVGERVKVKILSGGEFEAFVSRIIHSVYLQQGTELNSFSQVSFTHVKY